MLYKEHTFEPPDPSTFQKKALFWASRQSHCSYFNNCGVPFPHGGFCQVLFAGVSKFVNLRKGQSFQDLFSHISQNPSWLTGYFSYDLKNELEELQSEKEDLLAYEEVCFYEPKTILFFEGNIVRIVSKSESPSMIAEEIQSIAFPTIYFSPFVLENKISKKEYIDIVNAIKVHIEKGDVYELNFCMELFQRDVELLPTELYFRLIAQSPAPFSVFQKINDKYLLSCSPERFLKKDGTCLVSQPIKGTAPRGMSQAEDQLNKGNLLASEKERAENLMIVDLVRNDLSRTSITGTTQVEELFGIYSFAQVHQMISTVTCRIRENDNFIDCIRYAFPMGSMTGAPKIRAMELIEKYEKSRRGLFSGSVGYITPEGNFDFNVVIRSLLYNSTSKYLSLQVGSAITFDADPHQEYEECLLKAKAFVDLLSRLSPNP